MMTAVRLELCVCVCVLLKLVYIEEDDDDLSVWLVIDSFFIIMPYAAHQCCVMCDEAHMTATIS